MGPIDAYGLTFQLLLASLSQRLLRLCVILLTRIPVHVCEFVQARKALCDAGGDMQAAVDKLLSGA